MKDKKNLSYLLIIFIWMTLWGSYEVFFEKFFLLEGVCTKVLDGDTIELTLKNKMVSKIRLLYIDAPESKQLSHYKRKNGGGIKKIGNLSTKILKQMIQGKKIQVYYKKRDRYKRVLGEIFIKDKSINLEMIKKGGALIYWFTQFESLKQKNDYLTALHLAVGENRGIWNYKGFYDPYKWRKKFKRKKSKRKPKRCRKCFSVSSK